MIDKKALNLYEYIKENKHKLNLYEFNQENKRTLNLYEFNQENKYKLIYICNLSGKINTFQKGQ